MTYLEWLYDREADIDDALYVEEGPEADALVEMLGCVRGELLREQNGRVFEHYDLEPFF